MAKKKYTLYLPVPLARKLDEVARERHGAKSALVEEALRASLEPQQHAGIEDGLARRLNEISRALAAVARDQTVANETLALFVRYFLTATPPVPDSDQESARLVGRKRYEVFTPDVKDAVWTALQSLASAPKQERTLTGLAVLIQSNALVAALSPYTLEGAYGHLLDGASEELASADVLHVEMEELMPHKALVPPVLTYLFHRLEARFDGRPTLLILDEAWTFLDDALFAARIREWLKTLRKKNVAVVFATQSLADIERSTIAPALLESCPTRIFLPNDRALEPQARSVYERFGLNARQIDILSTATPKRDYYAQTARGNRLFQLGLGPVALALCGASTPDDHKLIDRCLAHSDKSGFAARFLEAKGLAWTGDLIERWPRPATPPPVPQAPPPTPIEPAEAAPAAPAARLNGAAPRPQAAARTVKARTDVPPLPGLPGGPPLPERLSPFRVVAGKSKRSAP